MLTFFIVLLTVALVLNCLLLILLVLIQLPKKEAGAGLAFGGGATDALFGAGSGNVLTRITKYSAGVFFALALLLSVLNTHASRQAQTGAELKKAIGELPAVPAPAPGLTLPAATNNSQPAAMSGSNAAPLATGTNQMFKLTTTPPAAESTPPPAASNPPVVPAAK